MQNTVNDEARPLISIVIPVYNVEMYIERTLRSVMNQTYERIEIVVVDDGSTDRTLAVVKELSALDSRVRVIHKENGGVTSARLEGVRKAQGAYIGFVDGDDEVDPDMYACLISNALKYDADISHCGYRLVHENGAVEEYHGTGRLVKQDKPTGLRALLDGSMVEPGLWNKLFHKTLFHSLLHDGKMDLSIRNNEDLLMNYYLFSEADSSIFEDVCKYIYYAREQSATRSGMTHHKIFDPLRVRLMIAEMCDEGIRPEAERTALRGMIYVYSELVSKANNEHDYKAELQTIRRMIVGHRAWGKWLYGRNRIIYLLIRICPVLFYYIYRMYQRRGKDQWK